MEHDVGLAEGFGAEDLLLGGEGGAPGQYGNPSGGGKGGQKGSVGGNGGDAGMAGGSAARPGGGEGFAIRTNGIDITLTNEGDMRGQIG